MFTREFPGRGFLVLSTLGEQIPPLSPSQAADIILTAKATWPAAGASLILSPEGARYLAARGAVYRVPGWIGISEKGGPDPSFHGPGVLFRRSAEGTNFFWAGFVSSLDQSPQEAKLVMGKAERFNVKREAVLISLSQERFLLFQKAPPGAKGGYQAVLVELSPSTHPVETRLYRQESRVYFSVSRAVPPRGIISFQSPVSAVLPHAWQQGGFPLLGEPSPGLRPLGEDARVVGVARPVVVWEIVGPQAPHTEGVE